MDRSIRMAKRNFPARLARLRGDRSQRRFARDLGVFQQNINRYELGQSVPDFAFLVTVAMRENVRLDWLVFGRGSMSAGRN